MSDEFPETIGKYKVLGIIAKGGMGVVYKAIHPSLKRYVVIKKMTAKNRSGNAERFKKEAQILLDLQSPYIVHLYDYFTEGGYRYMVEELVDGEALDGLIKKQVSLPVPIAMLFLQDCCYALKYAHSKDIVHRDIKPGNLLISKRGEIKLADFGIASDSNGDSIAEKHGVGAAAGKNAGKTEATAANDDRTVVNTNLTRAGVALGTPAYMPPEQFEDSANVDRRADIYALGVMLYEMITGSKPYSGDFTEMLAQAKKGKYIKPEVIDKTIPKCISRLIHKMIRPKAKHRFQSIDAVLKHVKKYLSHYDTHELRVQIAKSVVTKKQYAYTDIEPKDKTVRLVKKITGCLAAVLALFFICWNTGVIHNTILSKWYSAVNFEITMPHSLFNQMDLPMKIVFFENDNDEIPEVPGSARTFVAKGSRLSDKVISFFKGSKEVKSASQRNEVYSMRKVYLKNGDYRAKIVVGPYVWWKSFSVSDEDFEYDCDFLKNMKRHLTINPGAFDSETQEEITEKCNFQLFYKNEWVDISSVPAENLYSAMVWKVKISCDGYESETFSLLIDWYQDDLIVSAALKKKQ